MMMRKRLAELQRTYIRPRLGICTFKNGPEHVDGCFWLDGDAGAQAERVDVADEFWGVGFVFGIFDVLVVAFGAVRVGSVGFGTFGGGGVESGFVVEAVQVCAGGFEGADPLVGLGLLVVRSELQG